MGKFKGWQRSSIFRPHVGRAAQQGDGGFIDEKAYQNGANGYTQGEQRKLEKLKLDNTRIQQAALMSLKQTQDSRAQAKDARDAVAAQDRHKQAEYQNSQHDAADQAFQQLEPDQQSDLLMHKWYGMPMQHQAGPMDPQTEEAFNKLPDETKAALRLHKAFGMPLPTNKTGSANPMQRPDVAPHIAAANQAQAMVKSAQAEMQSLEQEQTVHQPTDDPLAPPTTIRTRVKRPDVSAETYKQAQEKVALAQQQLEQHRRAALNALQTPAGQPPGGIAASTPQPGQSPAAPVGQQQQQQQQQPPAQPAQATPQPQQQAQPPGGQLDPSRFGEVHVNPQTGQKAAYDNTRQMWVPVP